MRYLRMLVAMMICGMMVQGCFAAQPAQADIDAFMKACETRSWDDVQKYLSISNFNVNAQRSSDGVTGLMLAAKAGRYWIVCDLLSKGANPYIKDNVGKTTLEWSIDGPHEINTYLVRGDNRLLILDRLAHAAPVAWTAVDAAREYAEKASAGSIVDYLSGKVISIDVAGEFFQRPDMVYTEQVRPRKNIRLMLPARETIADSNTFMQACETGSEPGVQKYLAMPNFNINVQRPSDGATGLMLAAKEGFTKIVILLTNAQELPPDFSNVRSLGELERYMPKPRINVYIKDNAGRTALNWAIDGIKKSDDKILNEEQQLIILVHLLATASINWPLVDSALEDAKKVGALRIAHFLKGHTEMYTYQEQGLPGMAVAQVMSTGYRRLFCSEALRGGICVRPDVINADREGKVMARSAEDQLRMELARMKMEEARKQDQQRIAKEKAEAAKKAKPKGKTPKKRVTSSGTKSKK